jgi:hypothetical protein
MRIPGNFNVAPQPGAELRRAPKSKPKPASARIECLESAGRARGKSVDLLYIITVLDPGHVKSLTIINISYNSVNNQFIPNGIGIAKLE